MKWGTGQWEKFPWRSTLSGKPEKLRFLFLLVLVFSLVLELNAEVIKVSLLKRDRMDFSIKRDIFSPGKLPPDVQAKMDRVVQPVVKPEEKKTEEEKEEDKEKKLEEEIRRSVLFEGYVLKDEQNHALLSVNGELFVAGRDDMILEKIKIIKIDKEMVTIEVESKVFEIKIKEEEENEEIEENRF